MHSKPRCLILDRDREHACRLSEFCDERGWSASHHTVSLASDDSVDEAELQRCKDLAGSEEWDAAFVDSVMGLEFLRELARSELQDTELFAMATQDSSELAEACIRLGCSYYFCKPFAESSVAGLLEDIREESIQNGADEAGIEPNCTLDQFGLLRGSSRAMRKLFRLIRKVGPTEATALIVGESGTGKKWHGERVGCRDYSRDFRAVRATLFDAELLRAGGKSHRKRAVRT